MNNRELNALLSAMRASRVTFLEVQNNEQRLRLQLPSPKPQLIPIETPRPVSIPETRQVCATSPSIGTFLRRGVDDGLPLLEPGKYVSTGEVLGYVCQGPVRLVVDAPDGGVICDGGPQDGAVIGLGDTLFKLEVTP